MACWEIGSYKLFELYRPMAPICGNLRGDGIKIKYGSVSVEFNPFISIRLGVRTGNTLMRNLKEF